MVYLTEERQVGGSLLRNRLFQNAEEFLGKSPWPVVDVTNITSVKERRCFYFEITMADLQRDNWEFEFVRR